MSGKLYADNTSMRIIIADCSVVYTGRGNTTLERAVRTVMWKRDGSVSIHSDESNKPLNYMGGKKIEHTVSVDPEHGCPVWVFEARNESITVVMHAIHSDTEHQLAEQEPGLVRDGTEAHLQAWLSEHIQELDDDLVFIEREHRTDAGSVDLLCRRKSTGRLVAVEVKRSALLGVVYQTVRYIDAINRLHEEDDEEFVEGMVAAVDIRPTARALAEKKDISVLEVPYGWNSSAN